MPEPYKRSGKCVQEKSQKCGDFFEPVLLEGGVLALEFFKGRDLSTASSIVRAHSPEKGVSLHLVMLV